MGPGFGTNSATEPFSPSAGFIQIVCTHMNGRAASSGKLMHRAYHYKNNLKFRFTSETEMAKCMDFLLHIDSHHSCANSRYAFCESGNTVVTEYHIQLLSVHFIRIRHALKPVVGLVTVTTGSRVLLPDLHPS